MTEKAIGDERVVFAVDSGMTTAILGVSHKAWLYMRDGKTHTFDLRKMGFPINIVLLGGKTRAHIIDHLGPLLGSGPKIADMHSENAIPEDEKAITRMRNATRPYVPHMKDEEIDNFLQTVFAAAAGEVG